MAERLRPEEMTEPPSDDPPSKRMSSVANVDVDDILKEIAKALYKNSDIDDLGKALGFGPGEIGRQIAENDKRGGNHMGTLDLLRMWQNRQTPSTEKAALRSALLEAGFDNLADQHLSTPVPESDQYTVQQTTEDCSKNKGDNEAMPSEMMKLREQLKRRYRKEFGEIKTSPVDSESRTWLQYIYDSLVLMLGFAREKEEPIDYDGSFKFIKTDTQKGFVTRLAFIGEAGVGKSTLFAKIALDWAEGKILQESFREIKESGFFGDTVMAHFPDDSEIKGEWVDAHVRKNQRKVLILLDGLDEAHIDIKKPNCNDAIVSIMRGERFIDTPVLISTRPFGADQIKSIMTINDHYTFDKTTSYPSSPNTRTSTTAAAATTISQKGISVQSKSNEESSSPTHRSGLLPSTDNFDDTLVADAKRVREDPKIDTLGKKLGFTPEDVHGYIATNHKTQNVIYDGTLQMLWNWRKDQKSSTERGALKTALEQSGQIRLADYLFPSDKTTSYLSSPNNRTSTTTPTTAAAATTISQKDKTTSYPSSPNTRTSTTTPTAAAATTISQKAFFIITLLAWVAVTVSGTTPEISSTTSDTVNIPCLFGEGTVRNIFWSYNDGNGRHKILFLADGNLHKEAEYANRASLQDDFSTLILKDITVADEGTYYCVVDRQGQTAVTNINTQLNVFSLRPDTLPVISPCTGADESSSCSVHGNKSFTLTCTLPNVYPVEDAELIWYQDGQHVSSTDNRTQNDDGTTDISQQIQVSETGNFTCNATYLSANGKENTAVSVEAWIILPTDVAYTPGKNLTSAQIAGIGLLLVCILMAIINLISIGRRYYRGAACELNEPQLNKGRRSFRRDENELDETGLNQASERSAVNRTNCEEVAAEASSHPIRGDTET